MNINDLYNLKIMKAGFDIHKGTTATTAASGTYMGFTVCNSGAYTFICDGVTHSAVTFDGGVTVYGDITSMDAGASNDAVILIKQIK